MLDEAVIFVQGSFGHHFGYLWLEEAVACAAVTSRKTTSTGRLYQAESRRQILFGSLRRETNSVIETDPPTVFFPDVSTRDDSRNSKTSPQSTCISAKGTARPVTTLC